MTPEMAGATLNPMSPITLAPGLTYHPDYLDRPAQEQLLQSLREITRQAPLFTPRMPRTGKPFSVRMTNCGRLGWVSDVERLSLPADASRDRRALARHAGPSAARLGGPERLSASARCLPDQFLRARRPAWGCTRTRTRRSSRPPWFRCPSATRRCSAMAAWSARTRRARSGSAPVTRSCSAARHG